MNKLLLTIFAFFAANQLLAAPINSLGDLNYYVSQINYKNNEEIIKTYIDKLIDEKNINELINVREYLRNEKSELADQHGSYKKINNSLKIKRNFSDVINGLGYIATHLGTKILVFGLLVQKDSIIDLGGNLMVWGIPTYIISNVFLNKYNNYKTALEKHIAIKNVLHYLENQIDRHALNVAWNS